MELSALKDLYKSMKEQNIERNKFSFIFNGIKFDVLYFIDEIPNVLAFGIVEHNFYFEISKASKEKRPFFFTCFILRLTGHLLFTHETY